MRRLILEKDVFDVDSDLSNGLICGLKKLSDNGFSFSHRVSEDNLLLNICYKEGIEFSEPRNEVLCDTFILKGKMLQRFTELKSEVLKVSEHITTFYEVVDTLMYSLRSAKKERSTKETSISIELELDGNGQSEINTGIGFFDHMLDQIARHANINLRLFVKGDLLVDEHHTVEDTGITLGEAIAEALGEKIGIQRYGFVVPMDESVAECALDLSGRARLNFNCNFTREKVGEFPTELVEEFFLGLSSGLKANIYIRADGKNEHHKIESIFKAFAKALNEACRFDERNNGRIPSTKGVL